MFGGPDSPMFTWTCSGPVFDVWIVVEFATPPFGFDFTSTTLTTSLRLFPLNSAGVSSHEIGQEP